MKGMDGLEGRLYDTPRVHSKLVLVTVADLKSDEAG